MTAVHVTIEDTGQALEAIAQQAWGDTWAGMHVADRAVVKQDMLTYLLPGLTVILDQVNAQLDHDRAEVARQRADEDHDHALVLDRLSSLLTGSPRR